MKTYVVKIVKWAFTVVEAESAAQAEEIARMQDAEGFLEMDMDMEVEVGLT